MDELKLIGANEMKNRILINFCVVFIVNIILDILLYKYNRAELGLRNTIILLIGSYIVYWILNLYIYFLRNSKQTANYSFLCISGLIACSIALCILLINLRNDLIIFFPIMYIVAMLSTFLNWVISDKKD